MTSCDNVIGDIKFLDSYMSALTIEEKPKSYVYVIVNLPYFLSLPTTAKRKGSKSVLPALSELLNTIYCFGLEAFYILVCILDS